MSTAMDLHISADADIKRLREMVQKLEDKNAAVKTPDSPRLGREPSSPVTRYKREKMSSSPVLERVAVKLHLDDVPLMDLSEEDSEEEDSWLYISPIRPATPAQKSVSPYKYLKQSIDHQNDLNKVRGSLMAKLESIAAQEESLSRSPPKDTSSSNMNRTFIVDERPRRHDYDDDLEALEISGSETYPVRRRGAPAGISPKRPPQTKLYKPWENLSFGDDDDENDDPIDEAPVVKRRGGTFSKSVAPRGQSPRSHDDVDAGVVRPRGRSSHSFTMETPDSDNEDCDYAPVVRRGGAKPTAVNPPAAHNDGVPVVTKVQRRGQASPNFVTNIPSDDDDDDPVFDAPVVRRRGAGNRQSVPVAGISMGSPQIAWQGENDDDDMGPVRPRRRATPKNDDDDDGDFEAAVVRRRGPPSPRPADDSLVVRRRGAPQDGQVRPRGSGLPTPQQGGGIPPPTKRSTPSRLRVQDTEVKRRSLPQVPSDSMVQPRGSGARIRSNSPAGATVPRASKLVQPRRGIPGPRATSSYYAAESDQNWQDGCY